MGERDSDSAGYNPRRPLPPQVYRRRRIVVGVALLVVLALVVAVITWAVNALRGDDDEAEGNIPAPHQTEAPTETEPAEPESSSSAAPEATDEPVATECDPAGLNVLAATDQGEYGPEEEPVLELTIRNTGAHPCEVNVGSNQQEFLVTSGSDRIFSTVDCQVDGEDFYVTLEPDQEETARFVWPKTRTVPGCETVSTNLGSGTYRVTTSVGAISSEPVSFVLNQG